MANHPNRAMPVSLLQGSETFHGVGLLKWTWTAVVKYEGRAYHVRQSSLAGACGAEDGWRDEARKYVKAHLQGGHRCVTEI